MSGLSLLIKSRILCAKCLLLCGVLTTMTPSDLCKILQQDLRKISGREGLAQLFVPVGASSLRHDFTT